MTPPSTDRDTQDRLVNLIKRYQGGAEDRNAYKDLVTQRLRGLDQEALDLLMEGRDILEGWVKEKVPAQDAVHQWSRLLEEGEQRLTDPVLEAFLTRFPPMDPGAVDWRPFLLRDAGKWLPRTLVNHRFVDAGDLRRLADEHPKELFATPTLDVLIEQRIKCPPAIWEECVVASSRHAELLQPPEILVRCFEMDRRKTSEKLLLELLGRAPKARPAVLKALLSFPQASVRFVRYLALDRAPSKDARPEGFEAARKRVIHDWVAVCRSALEGSPARARPATLVLATIYLGAQGLQPKAPGYLKDLAEEAAEVFGTAAGEALTRMEGGRAKGSELLMVLESEVLYAVFQEYLRGLPTGSTDTDGSPERALRHERFQGMKEAIDAILGALEEEAEPSPLADEIEVALFNLGVRPLGSEGDEVEYDVHLHRTKSSGILPGDDVRVVRPGRYIGSGSDRLILRRAVTEPIP